MKNLYYRFLKKKRISMSSVWTEVWSSLQTSDTAELYCWRFLTVVKKKSVIITAMRRMFPIREFNPVKDASDTEIAIRLAMTLGAKEILILGATGGRIDHLWANVQSLAIPFKAGIDAVIMDTQNKIRLIGGGETHLKKGETYGPYFSVFPLGEEVYGFSIKGAKYPLDNHTLIPYDSLCVSNQFQEDEVTISFMKGIVILMETKDR